MVEPLKDVTLWRHKLSEPVLHNPLKVRHLMSRRFGEQHTEIRVAQLLSLNLQSCH